MRTWVVALLFGLPAGAQDAAVYTVDAGESRLVIEVGRDGFLKVFGHDHRIRVERFSGEVTWDAAAPERSRFALDIDAASLTVADEEVSDADRATIQSEMQSKALDLPQHPRITFESSAVELRDSRDGVHRLKVTGRLALRGVEKRLEVPLTLEVTEGRLVAKGELELESDAWGVPQISAAGGAVKTSKDLVITFEIVATSRGDDLGGVNYLGRGAALFFSAVPSVGPWRKYAEDIVASILFSFLAPAVFDFE